MKEEHGRPRLRSRGRLAAAGLQALPPGPESAALLAHLEASVDPARAAPGDPWQLDGWSLRAHPDLEARLREVAAGSGGSPASPLGVPLLLAPGGRAVAYALGTATIALRLPDVAGDEPALDRRPVEGLPGWSTVDAWLSALPSDRGTARLRGLVADAVAAAARP